MPLIVAGDGFPERQIVDTPANLVDIYPFIIDCVGESGRGMIDPDHPGISLARLANGEKPERTVLSEYHGMGSTTGAFAIRAGKFKYVHYAKYPPQLFDLVADPDEANDLSADPRFAEILAECEATARDAFAGRGRCTCQDASGRATATAWRARSGDRARRSWFLAASGFRAEFN